MGIMDVAGLPGALTEAGGGLISDIFGASSAQANRDWQTNMANTAHQREVKDLRAAGLNPILSATGGSGAATPAGNVFTPANPLQGMSSNLTNAKNAETSARSAAAQIGLATEQAKTALTQGKLNSAAALREASQTTLNQKQLGAIFASIQRDLTQSRLNSASAAATEAVQPRKGLEGSISGLITGAGKQWSSWLDQGINSAAQFFNNADQNPLLTK